MKGKRIKELIKLHFDSYIEDNEEYDVESLGSSNKIYWCSNLIEREPTKELRGKK